MNNFTNDERHTLTNQGFTRAWAKGSYIREHLGCVQIVTKGQRITLTNDGMKSRFQSMDELVKQANFHV